MTRTERIPDEERVVVAARRARAMLTFQARMQTEPTSDEVVVVSRAIVTSPTRMCVKVKRVPGVHATARAGTASSAARVAVAARRVTAASLTKRRTERMSEEAYVVRHAVAMSLPMW